MSKEGDTVALESPLITLETEKATMDVPSSAAGSIAKLHVSKGSRVNAGDLVATVRGRQPAAAEPAAKAAAQAAAPNPEATVRMTVAAAPAASAATLPDMRGAHASPSVRRFARELGVDLARVTGTGFKGRISEDDVKAFVKKALAGPPRGESAGGALPRVPEVDFAAFGAVEVKPLGRIQKISGARLQASWVNIPHVTQHDEADITELEKLRASLKERASQPRHQADAARVHCQGLRQGHRAVPELRRARSTLAGQNLVFKKYLHLGFAADTPNGLVVPVIRDAGRKDVYELARDLGELAGKARAGKLDGGRDAGRLLHDLEPRRHRRHRFHAHHQRARGRDPRRFALAAASGLEGRQVRAATHAAAVAFLRPSRHRRRRGRALRRRAGRSAGRAAEPHRGGALSQPVEQRVPDLGEFHDVEVIEVLVKPGDRIEPESPLITLETDKATMDVPATVAGVVKEVKVKKGDRVSKDSLIALVSVGADDTVKIPGLRKTAMLGSPSSSASPPPTAGSAAKSDPSAGEPAADISTQLLVIGAGPGGYTAAFRAADLGLSVTLVDHWPQLGGVCLNVGCIPSKALLHAARVIEEAESMSAHGIRFAKPEIDPAGTEAMEEPHRRQADRRPRDPRQAAQGDRRARPRPVSRRRTARRCAARMARSN